MKASHPQSAGAVRSAQRRTFISGSRFASAELEALPVDASFRRYFRLHGVDKPVLLMDAPPPQEDVRPFVTVARHLLALGFSAPKLYECDARQGFLLLEDFGSGTFTRLLSSGADELCLYELAVDSLVALHSAEATLDIDVPSYDNETLIDEAMLLVDWYLPEVTGRATREGLRGSFKKAWQEVLQRTPIPIDTLVLRDFHVDNLMQLHGRDGTSACGLLDFQDALKGSAAYDVVSLLEDARRDLSPSLTRAMLDRYRSKMNIGIDDFADFMSLYRVLGAQRHCKVLGIFVRLWHRDNKDTYLHHLPRVARLLREHLRSVELMPLAQWMDVEFPEFMNPESKEINP